MPTHILALGRSAAPSRTPALWLKTRQWRVTKPKDDIIEQGLHPHPGPEEAVKKTIILESMNVTSMVTNAEALMARKAEILLFQRHRLGNPSVKNLTADVKEKASILNVGQPTSVE